MCGQSLFKSNGEWEIELGYYGGSLSIDDKIYENPARDYTHDKAVISRDEMAIELSKLSKTDLIEALLMMVDNATEAD